MILFKNAKVYDGTGSEPFLADVRIDGERIAEVGVGLDAPDGCEVIGLDGLSLAPGFIDAHSHNDWFAIKNQPAKYFEPFIRQGICSFVTGNCGLSAIGFEADSPYVDKVGGGLFGYRDTKGTYASAGPFFEAVDGHSPCNIATLVGHCSARVSVAGYENRPLDGQELARMLDILETSLKEGAAGVSLGLMYEPGIYAPTEELKSVVALCEKYDRPLTVHPRACSAVSMDYPLLGRPHLLRALDELVEITRGTRVKLEYSHAIFVGRKSFKCKDELVSILHRLREDGVDAGFDIYDELLGVSTITVVLPAWFRSLSPQQKRSPWVRFKLGVLIKATILLLGFDFRDIQIAYIGEGYEKYEGKSVHGIALQEGKNDLDMYLELCELSNFAGRVNIGPYSTPEIVGELSRDPYCIYMTDAWVEDRGVQNPAIYDCFPKFLKHSLLGRGDSMGATVRKMSGAVADRFKLRDRGYVREGSFADITIFDEKELIE
ncbi:MAG: amidohydrolase family protein, partial [Candidatus Cryptobacteroides sp.]